MPGPIGNINGATHGRRSSRPGVVLARLGKRYSQIYQDVLRLRRGVESILKQNHGGVTLLQAAKVQSLCRLELSCRIAEQTLRDTPTLPSEQIQQTRHSIGQWSCQRDNLLAALLGDSGGAIDPWAALDQARQNAQQARTCDPPAVADPNVDQGPVDATTGSTRIQEQGGQP
jgi:hypothetical protein